MASFIKTTFDYGDRHILPNCYASIEDKRAKGGKIEVWRGAKILWAGDDLRTAKLILRGLWNTENWERKNG